MDAAEYYGKPSCERRWEGSNTKERLRKDGPSSREIQHNPYQMFSRFAAQLRGFTPHRVWPKNDEQSSEREGSPTGVGSFSKCLLGAD